MFERFTDSARRVVVSAQEEARDLHHGYIGTEHQLLGLLADHDRVATQVLSSFGVSANRAREEVMKFAPRGEEPVGNQIPFTPGAKRVLELSVREAASLGHEHVTPAHLLLGLVGDADGLAMRILHGFGADPQPIRAAVLPLMAHADHDPPASTARGARVSDQTFYVRPDPRLRRLLMAAGSRALSEGRTEFTPGDVVAALIGDPHTADLLAALWVDDATIRAAIERGLKADAGGDATA